VTTTGVVIGCYNHERYIAECLDSVLAQTRRPDRVIVVDDSSNDDSRSIVESYRSEGVDLITCDRVGPSVVFNTGVEAIDTDVVAIVSADDSCLANRLERQVWLLDRYEVDLIMGLPVIIDEDSHVRSDALAPEFFEPFESGSGPLLGQLFTSGNFICAATATFRRSTFQSLGGFHPGLLQLQDFHLWLKWSWRRMLLSNERFSNYRKAPGSLSAASNDRRMNAERQWVYRHLFDDVPDEVIQATFPHIVPASPKERHRGLDLASIYLQHVDPLVYQLGCELLLDCLDHEDGVVATADYGITLQRIFSLTAQSDVERSVRATSLMDEILGGR